MGICQITGIARSLSPGRFFWELIDKFRRDFQEWREKFRNRLALPEILIALNFFLGSTNKVF